MAILKKSSTESTHKTSSSTTTSTKRTNKSKLTNSLASDDAESTFAEFLKRQDDITSSNIERVNINLLRGYSLSDIMPCVEVDLVREKDIENDRRVKLSKKAGFALYESLTYEFYDSNPGSAELILLVRIFVASDGSRKGRLLAGDFLGGGAAKLSVGYCLFSKSSGKVLMAKLQTLRDGGFFGLLDIPKDCGPVLVTNLADLVGEMIHQEIGNALEFARQ